MTHPLFIVILVLALLLIGGGITGNSIFGEKYSDDPLPSEISKLPQLSIEEVENYENYKEFVDKTNDLILILNEKGKFNVPLLENTREAWSEASKKITKYSPLI